VAVETVNPDDLPDPVLYHHIAIATGSRMVFIAGQNARDTQGRPVGPGDLAAQTEQAYLNVAAALTRIGATFDDVAKLTIFVVDWHPDMMPALEDGVARASAKLGIEFPVRTTTLLGVSSLAEPDMLVEVEATAVLA
jgi:enamine deaminase RidA (YjgF/YER057c/UK114 family)